MQGCTPTRAGEKNVIAIVDVAFMIQTLFISSLQKISHRKRKKNVFASSLHAWDIFIRKGVNVYYVSRLTCLQFCEGKQEENNENCPFTRLV